MDNLTLDKWCSEQGLTDEKIDFITSFMTLLSTSKYGGYGLEFIIEKFNYKEEAFLHRCYEGGICKPLAIEILQTK